MNKIITLDDIKNRSIDDIVELYRYGYRLEDNHSTYNPFNSATLQTCPEGCTPQSEVDTSYKSGLYLGVAVGVLWGIIAGTVLSFLVIKRGTPAPTIIS